MANKIVQLKDGNDNLYPLSVIQAYAVEEASAAWTATTGSSSAPRLTDNITLSKGYWILEFRVAYTASNDRILFELMTVSGTSNISSSGTTFNSLYYGNAMGRCEFLIHVTSATAVFYVRQGSSTEVTYSLLERGGLTAFKIDPCNVATIASTVTDISNQFTYKLANGTGSILAYYDSASGRVWGSVSVFNATTVFDTSTAIYQVASAYRPSANVVFPMMTHNSSGWSAYRGVLNTSGNITQGLTSTADSVYGTFEYYIS